MERVVYVLNCHGEPMMPMKRFGKVRRMLNSGEAKVVQRNPFTIQLTYETKTNYKQPLNMGIDMHRRKSAISVTSETTEYFAVEIEHRQDAPNNIKQRKQFRQARRRRNSSRRSHKRLKGQKAPKNTQSNANLVYGHEMVTMMKRVCKFLPVDKIIMEIAESPSEKYDELSWGLRDIPTKYMDPIKAVRMARRNYTLLQDRHTCQYCKGKRHDPILVVNDMSYKFEPVTLCKTCNEKFVKLSKGKDKEKYRRWIENLNKKNMKFRNSKIDTFGNIKYMIYTALQKQGKILGINSIDYTYGIPTKIIRMEKGMEYSPVNNARVIANSIKDTDYLDGHYYVKFRRNHNRSLHNALPKKGGVRIPKIKNRLFGFSPYDEVRYLGKKHPEFYNKVLFITKRRKTGYFSLGTADGKTLINSVKYSLLKLVKHNSPYLVMYITK